jgi:hypothetical protein
MTDSHSGKRTIEVELSPLERTDPMAVAGAVNRALRQAQVEIRIKGIDLSAREMDQIRAQVEEMIPAWLLLEGERMEKSQETDPPVYIRPGAFLRSMFAIAWCAFRHPWKTTEIDLTTGRVIAHS